MNHKKLESGFTLIELMVGVAIIGVLTMLAIPEYDRYVMRGRKLEAKTSLIAAYTVLRAFATDNQSYTVCLKSAGYMPEKGSRFYTLGFGGVPSTCGVSGTDSCDTMSWKEDALGNMVANNRCASGAGESYFLGNASVSRVPLPSAPPVIGSSCSTSVSRSTFKMQAIANLGYTFSDVWSIDQSRGLQNDQDALIGGSSPCGETIVLE